MSQESNKQSLDDSFVDESTQMTVDTTAEECAYDVSPYVNRTSLQDIAKKSAKLQSSLAFPTTILDALPTPTLLLDDNRQVLACNKAFAELLKSLDLPLQVGLRPGEALNCIHAHENTTGCGTSDFCPSCGAFQSIIAAQCGKTVDNRCDICMHTENGPIQINAVLHAAPIAIEDINYTVISLQNITPAVRRHLIDRAFFHNILNTTWIINGYANLLSSAPEFQDNVFIKRIASAGDRLVGEIMTQLDLAYAQIGDLKVNLQEVRPLELIKEMAANYKKHADNNKLILLTSPKCQDIAIVCDPDLLKRVLHNLLRSVSDASESGSLIEFGYEHTNYSITFWFQNRTLTMTEEQQHAFRLKFTINDPRTINSYTLEFIGCRYLHAKFDVSCDQTGGTRFEMQIPTTLERS